MRWFVLFILPSSSNASQGEFASSVQIGASSPWAGREKKDPRCPGTESRGSHSLARASPSVSEPGLGVRGRNGGAYCHDAFVCLRAQRAASLRQGATQLWSQYHLDGLTFAARDG